MKFSRPKGTFDIYGEDSYKWQGVEKVIRELCRDCCIEEIRTPVFEFTDLFKRGVGETSDIVQKEMFSFTDAGGRNYTLRPELTAGAARAFIENGLYGNAQPTKLFYIAPAFRAERPQKGRQRQFTQWGVEVYGSYSPATDAEVISVMHELFRRLGIKNITLHINSLGNNDSRALYNAELKKYLAGNIDGLCETCRERFDKNPLRILDCKSESCKKIVANAPQTVDLLLPECKKHFEDLQKYLTSMGIEYIVDPKIVRGLDYYTRTVFEFISTDLGAQSTVGGGGRYDNLIEECGGNATGATGFAIGIERLLIILDEQGIDFTDVKPVEVFVGAMGENAMEKALGLVYEMRKNGTICECDTLGRSVKAQFKYADKIKAKYSVMIGDSELETSKCKIKNMETGEQTELELSSQAIAEYIK